MSQRSMLQGDDSLLDDEADAVFSLLERRLPLVHERSAVERSDKR